ncbi:MAG: hypothetical protein FOGNACKC_05505 [Anaerolineae bacterium]|nr:hypothetical protein [Anaerolineae bacterium]
MKLSTKTIVIILSVVSILASIILLAIIYYLVAPNKESVADIRHAAGLGLAIPGDYMVVTSPQQDQVVNDTVQVQVVLTNPDPDYRLNLVVYLPRPPGLQFAGGAGMPISKILNTDHISVPNLPGPAEGEEITQGVVWNGEIEASGAVTLTLSYDLAAPLPATIQLRALAYDGLSGEPVDEETLSFLTEPGQVLPAPTPRYSLTPVAIPDRPPGRVLSPTLAAALQSQSFESHERAVAGVNVSGADLIGLTEETLPYKFRALSLTQCYYLGVYMVNRAALEFDTRAVPPDFSGATLRLRALPPNPGGHTLTVYAGRWEWLFGQETDETGHPLAVTNPAAWQQHDPTPLAALPVSGPSAVIANLSLPRPAINAGGITRLLLISSDEADTPPANSCFAGGEPGLGGAITLPELFIQ